MILKKRATFLETPICIGDIIKQYILTDSSKSMDYYLVVDILSSTYLVVDLNLGQILKHDFCYHPTVQYEKVA